VRPNKEMPSVDFNNPSKSLFNKSLLLLTGKGGTKKRLFKERSKYEEYLSIVCTKKYSLC
jgi:hypothetical protein